MAKFEALLEIYPEKVESLIEYIAYCKYYFKPKREEKIENYLFQNGNNWYLNRNNKYKLLDEFEFLKKEINDCVQDGNRQNWCENQLAKKLKNYKSGETLKDFPLNWLKREIIRIENRYINFTNDTNIQKIKQISGIYTEERLQDLQNYINKLPKHSFAIWFKFKLKAPYFSKDDDEFYIIQNPILKETNFKVPMIRGSGWKGALASAFRELINNNDNSENEKKEDLKEKKEDRLKVKIENFLRIFGAGSEIIKELEKYLKSKSKNLDKFKDEFLNFVLFELGLEVNQELIQAIRDAKSYNDVSDILAKKVWDKYKNNQKNLPLEFQTHKGRVMFYPTYFNKLSLEIINPHDRRKRAGINPIHYEVVPKNTEGIFQLIYIPFDAILKSEEEVKNEAKEDLTNLTQALKKLSDKGIGAKTKLGWGRFEIEDKKVCLNSELETPKEWK